ncbi:hypothetical protein P152DRAFT_472290 [Eremomyces bilateralis CBS 781.70]|uniref:Uncharacterized protein n=1 Tax=Eremomyces bilateralis CBS 781.70 TaxID=1392243 RepID=A0A6G1G9J4_9PEZI|nr:uncharacterized protein P152DRAFT_472290 [Eremomyces bilateralis CBS 781.70]KAF1814539.1 hypothetical protein P152DRAFT_472290 [Eremomyces bilateralis CBS 781.70]
MISWGTVQTLLITLGPLLLPKLIAFVQSIRSASKLPNNVIQRCPPRVAYTLNLLLMSAVVALLFTLPALSPENIFKATGSRLRTPTDELFNRLKALHPLTPTDEALKRKFVSLESRLLYFQYGPDVLASCQFCTSDDLNSYYYYAIPSVLFIHLAHIAVLGVVTSSLLSGRYGARWRTHATITGASLAAIELWVLSIYPLTQNTKATKLSEINHFYWRMRLVRGIAFALADSLLGLAIWLCATNRWLVTPPTVSERLDASTRAMEIISTKLVALGAMRNAIFRNGPLRERTEHYWREESDVMHEVLEDRDVLDGTKNALTRMDLDKITTAADQWSGDIMIKLQASEEPTNTE